MKFTCLTTNLKRGIGISEKITNKNLSLPILNNILIKTNKNKLQIMATDLEIGLNYFVLGEIKEEGSLLVPSRMLIGLLNNLKEEKITLETKGDKLYIQTKDFDLNIQGFPSEEFPIIPSIESDNYIEIDSSVLLQTFNQVVKSASAGFNKPELSSVYITIDDGNLLFVSTDSFRLSEKKVGQNHFKINGKKDIKLIIPSKTIAEIIKILQNVDDVDVKTKIYYSNNQVFFDFGNANLISRLIEGEFPNYQTIIPKTFQTKVNINKNDLGESIKLVSLFSSKIKDLNIQLDVKKQEMIIKGEDASTGEGVYRLKCMIDGDDAKVCFNYSYILDGLEELTNEDIFFGINEDGPALIKSSVDENYIYVLMPIRI